MQKEDSIADAVAEDEGLRQVFAAFDPWKLLQAQTFVLSDAPPPRVCLDAVCLFARSHGDGDGPAQATADAIKAGLARFVVISGSDGRAPGKLQPGEVWPGCQALQTQLRVLGVPAERILVAAWTEHTRQENQAYLRVALEQGWSRVALITQPHQLLRAMLGMLDEMRRINHWIRVYTLQPDFTDWTQEVPGSQGRLIQPRYLHLREEVVRLSRYAHDLATLDEYLNYVLRVRDALS
jgi:hypothetical protein